MLVDQIIAYETGELDTEGTLKLFADLIKTGTAWKLQGSYGRFAEQLIHKGYITPDGDLTPDGLTAAQSN